VFKTNPGSCHSRITIGVDKIDLTAKENVTVIRTARDQNQRADKNNFRREGQPPPHAPFKSAIGIPQSEIKCHIVRSDDLLMAFLELEATLL
jgi:hypothetical protein